MQLSNVTARKIANFSTVMLSIHTATSHKWTFKYSKCCLGKKTSIGTAELVLYVLTTIF